MGLKPRGSPLEGTAREGSMQYPLHENSSASPGSIAKTPLTVLPFLRSALFPCVRAVRRRRSAGNTASASCKVCEAESSVTPRKFWAIPRRVPRGEPPANVPVASSCSRIARAAAMSCAAPEFLPERAAMGTHPDPKVPSPATVRLDIHRKVRLSIVSNLTYWLCWDAEILRLQRAVLFQSHKSLDGPIEAPYPHADEQRHTDHSPHQ